MQYVFAFSGPQGSGKSKLSGAAVLKLVRLRVAVIRYGIKDTFTAYARAITSDLGGKFEGLASLKTMQLAISTAAESIEPTVWSKRYLDEVVRRHESGWSVVTDDIRTSMNFDTLREIAERPNTEVMLFVLQASEECRKARVSVWRDNGGYTEAGFDYSEHGRVKVIEVDTENTGEEMCVLAVQTLIEQVVAEHGQDSYQG